MSAFSASTSRVNASIRAAPALSSAPAGALSPLDRATTGGL
jgi:hypothetical protein